MLSFLKKSPFRRCKKKENAELETFPNTSTSFQHPQLITPISFESFEENALDALAAVQPINVSRTAVTLASREAQFSYDSGPLVRYPCRFDLRTVLRRTPAIKRVGSRSGHRRKAVPVLNQPDQSFLRLPLELRQMIYIEVFRLRGSSVEIRMRKMPDRNALTGIMLGENADNRQITGSLGKTCDLVGKELTPRLHHYFQSSRIKIGEMKVLMPSMLATCHQIHIEALHCQYGDRYLNEQTATSPLPLGSLTVLSKITSLSVSVPVDLNQGNATHLFAILIKRAYRFRKDFPRLRYLKLKLTACHHSRKVACGPKCPDILSFLDIHHRGYGWNCPLVPEYQKMIRGACVMIGIDLPQYLHFDISASMTGRRRKVLKERALAIEEGMENLKTVQRAMALAASHYYHV